MDTIKARSLGRPVTVSEELIRSVSRKQNGIWSAGSDDVGLIQLGGGVLYGRGTPAKALADGRVLGGGVFYGRGTPVKVLAYGRVLGGGAF